MFQFFKDFFTTKSAFERVVRGALLGAGGLAMIPAVAASWPAWIAPVLLTVGGLISAGEKNAPPPQS